MESMGLPQRWVDIIYRCVSSVSFSVLLNGYPCGQFSPTRGLRQRDLLSCYLFILCVEVLSGLIIKSQESRVIHSVKILRSLKYHTCYLQIIIVFFFFFFFFFALLSLEPISKRWMNWWGSWTYTRQFLDNSKI